MVNKKVIDIDSGTWMVVADIHGDLEDYKRIKDIYHQKKESGELNGLIFAGDMIHSYCEEDKSKEITDDLINLTKEDKNIHVLLGNHELAHIYNFTFAREGKEVTSNFEIAIKDNREKYIEFFKSLPLYVRTQGGVVISHAGASKEVSRLDRLEDLIELNHDDILKENMEDSDKGFNTLTIKQKEEFKKNLEQHLYGMPYEEALKRFRGVDAKGKEKYESLLQGEFFHKSHLFQRHSGEEEMPNLDMVWLLDMLFNGNENTYSRSDYLDIINKFLAKMSEDYTAQRFLVSGHIHKEAGFDNFEDKQLRIDSSAEVANPTAKSFLIIDANKTYFSVQELAENLCSLYPETIDKNLLEKVDELSKKYPIKTVYNKTLRKLKDFHGLHLDPRSLYDFEKKLEKEKVKVVGGIKPKNTVLNQTLIEIVEGLEKNNVKIGEILTDGGSRYGIKYEESPEMKGVLIIDYNKVIDNNQKYGPLIIKKVGETETSFAHVMHLDTPVGETVDNGKKVLIIKPLQITSTKENTERLIEKFKGQFKEMPEEMIKGFLNEYIFKRSVLEKPYTDLSEEEFLKRLLEEKQE